MMGDAKVLVLESRRSLEVDIGLLSREGIISVNPDIEKLGLLFLHFKRSRVTITAGPYVGLFPLNDSVWIEVRPKMPVSNIAHVVDQSRGDLRAVRGADRNYLAVREFGSGVLDFIAGNLVAAVEDIQLQGLQKFYNRETRVTSTPRGRILVADTLRQLWPSGRQHQVKTSDFRQTVNTPANRLIKTALIYYLNRARRLKLSREMVRRVDYCLNQFPGQVTELVGAERLDMVRSVERISIAGRERHYSRAVEIAAFMLSGSGVSLDEAGSDLTLQSFILNFETVFEDYIRNILSGMLAPTLVVRNGNMEGRKRLFDDTKEHMAQPDLIVFDPRNGRSLIVEVKYKEKPSRDDINQVIAYALSYQCKRAVLLHQRKEDSAHRVQLVGTISGIELSSYGFDLAASNLIAEEQIFAHWIREHFAADALQPDGAQVSTGQSVLP